MRRVRVVNRSRDRVLGTEVDLADGWWSRLRGLLGRPPLRQGEGILLTPCRSIHMLGMRYPIDVAFLDREGRVVALHAAVPPGLRTRGHREAAQALELPAGSLAAAGTEVGDSVRIEPAE